MNTTPTLTTNEDIAHRCAQLDLAVDKVRSTAEGMDNARGKPCIRRQWHAEHNKRVKELSNAIHYTEKVLRHPDASETMRAHAWSLHGYACRVLNAYLPLTPA
jgi:hypothetical protein